MTRSRTMLVVAAATVVAIVGLVVFRSPAVPTQFCARGYPIGGNAPLTIIDPITSQAVSGATVEGVNLRSGQKYVFDSLGWLRKPHVYDLGNGSVFDLNVPPEGDRVRINIRYGERELTSELTFRLFREGNCAVFKPDPPVSTLELPRPQP